MPTKSAISFGLVFIPIALQTATQDIDVHFNQLHKEDHSRVKYKKSCGHCGKELASEDIVKGYEFDKDQYVIVTEDDFEKIKTEKDKTMQILQFTKLDTINPIYYEKTYHAIPQMGGEKAFELLRTAMMQEQVVAIARTVLGTKDTLLALIPREEGILCQTMFFEEEIKAMPVTYSKAPVDEAQLQMAKMLIGSMVKPFAPELYHDEYQQKLRDLIAQKIEGKEIVSASAPGDDQRAGNVIDLMDALKKSIEQAGA